MARLASAEITRIVPWLPVLQHMYWYICRSTVIKSLWAYIYVLVVCFYCSTTYSHVQNIHESIQPQSPQMLSNDVSDPLDDEPKRGERCCFFPLIPIAVPNNHQQGTTYPSGQLNKKHIRPTRFAETFIFIVKESTGTNYSQTPSKSTN